MCCRACHAGPLPFAAAPTAFRLAAPVAASIAKPAAAPGAAPGAAPVTVPFAAWGTGSSTLLSQGRPSKPRWGPDYSAKTTSSVNHFFPSRRRILLHPPRYDVPKTVRQRHHLPQASLGTPPAVADSNPFLPFTSQQRVQPNTWHTQQYAFRDPRMEHVTKTLQTVAARHAAAHVSKLCPLELGTAATLEAVPSGCGFGPNPVSTAARPAEGSVGGRLGLPTFERIAAGSAVASGEDKARQITPSLGHLDAAMSDPKPRLGEIRPADALMQASEKVPSSLMRLLHAARMNCTNCSCLLSLQ